jgi:hypothetical protein
MGRRQRRLRPAFLDNSVIFSTLALLFICEQQAYAYSGRVIDALTKAPIRDALVTLNDTVSRTDAAAASK